MLVTLTVGQLSELIRVEVATALEGFQPAQRPALLDKRGLAMELGVSERTIDRLRELGMPVLMLLDSPRFQLGAVLEWLAHNGPRVTPSRAGNVGVLAKSAGAYGLKGA